MQFNHYVIAMYKNIKIIIWLAVGLFGLFALSTIALNRGESINALWLITAAVCIYAIAYRFYAAWIAATVLTIDETRATPAERLDNGRDFIPTNKWIVFGHHFAAIAGPGPLVGPTLASPTTSARRSSLALPTASVGSFVYSFCKTDLY